MSLSTRHFALGTLVQSLQGSAMTSEIPDPPPRRTKAVASLALGVVAAVAVSLALVVGISAIVADRPAATLRHVGVARVNGELVIYGCEDAGIGTAEVQRGGHPHGPLVWSAQHTGGKALKVLPIRATLPGYSVRNLGGLDQTLSLRRLTDARGVNLLRSYLVFTPATLAEGSIALQNGGVQSLASWLATTKNC